MDFFGVSCIVLQNTFIFSLEQGHCPGGKTAREVPSIVGFYFNALHAVPFTAEIALTFNLHADNCTVQNKNKYLPFFMRRVSFGMGYIINLHFLIAVHTKNRFDRDSGHIKRTLKRIDVLCPREMRDVICKRAGRNSDINPLTITWIYSQSLLVLFFCAMSLSDLTATYVFALIEKYLESCW